MRELGVLTAHMQQRTTTLACCMRIVPMIGPELYFTACSRDIVVGGHTYLANVGLDPTAMQMTAGLAVDNSEFSGFVHPQGIQEGLAKAGYYDGSTVYKFMVDYTNPGSGDSWKGIWGTLGEVQVKGVQFTAENRGTSQLLTVPITPLSQATCRATFGDEQCKATVHTNPGTVTVVTSQKQWHCTDLVGVRVDGFFDYGYLTWNTGNNTGLRMDVLHYDQAVGGILLIQKAVLLIEPGDTFTVREGCAKTKAACKAKANLINMDAEPDIPGNDVRFKIQRPA